MFRDARLLLSFNFVIATRYGSFRASKVRNIERAIEMEEVREGGVNEYVHSLVKPVSMGKKLIFERGYCNQFLNLSMNSLLGIKQTDPVTICIYDRTHSTILKSYCVNGWTITKWELSELDAGESGGVLLETVEMTYQALREGGQSW